MLKWILLIALTLANSNVSASIVQQSHSELGGIAAKVLEERARAIGFEDVDIEVLPLDGRVHLPLCGEPVSILSDRNQPVLGRVTVGMRCKTPEPWTIYLRGYVTSSVGIPVLKQPVNRSELIADEDVVIKSIQIDTDLRGIIIEPSELVGKEATRNLIAGAPLRQIDLKAPQIISRGQSITIMSEAGGLRVTMKGKALGNASAGDRIWVQNQSSNKRVEGQVTPRGEVLIR